MVRCRPWVGVSPVLSLDGRVFIAGYKYSQKVLIKHCCYCSTKLEMLEVSASWLFHTAMNILWERKYLVSESFYSVATHGLGTFQILPKSKSLPVHPSLYLLFRIHQCPTSLRCWVLLVNGSVCKTCGVQLAVLISILSWRGEVGHPSVLPSPLAWGVLVSTGWLPCGIQTTSRYLSALSASLLCSERDVLESPESTLILEHQDH